MKTCIFCDKQINKTYYTCKEHLPWYREYKDTEWLKELIRMDRKQIAISEKEDSISYIDNTNNYIADEWISYGSKVGRKARINHLKVIRLRQYYTYTQLGVIFECDRRVIQLIVARKAPYLIKKRYKV